MKRFLVLLLAAGLFLAFSLPAAAASIKFGGTYQYEGWYESNRKIQGGSIDKQSTGFQDHGLVFTTQITPAEGLDLIARGWVNNKIWGDNTAASTAGSAADSRDRADTAGVLKRENIEFDYLYIKAKVGPGFFQIGSAPSMLGTTFLDTDNPTNQVGYAFTGVKSWYFAPVYEKFIEGEVKNPKNSAAPTLANASDVDQSRFKFTFIKFGPNYDFGMTSMYVWARANRAVANAYADYAGFDPYFRGTFGPFYVEAEGYILYGKTKYDTGFVVPGQQDVDMRGYSAYAKARYTMGPAYVGAAFAWSRGDDPATTDQIETGAGSGREFKPTLILLNPDRDKWMGALGTGGNASPLGNTYTAGATNFWLYQGFVGFKPVPKLELVGTYSYAKLDKKPRVAGVEYVDDKLGHEVDVTATYKLYDNLSYMVGFGYLWAGDAFKGVTAATQIDNDWLLMHRLTFTF